MEKLSLLDKLKTLKQWQLQQQLDFAKLQELNHASTQNDSPQNAAVNAYLDHDENKENMPVNYPTTNPPKSFMDTMTSNELTNILHTVNYNDAQKENKNRLSAKVLKEQNLDSLQAHNRSNGQELDHWHMSGLRTVVFNKNVSPQDQLRDITLESFKEGLNTESEDNFSEQEFQLEMDGVTPMSETDDAQTDDETMLESNPRGRSRDEIFDNTSKINHNTVNVFGRLENRERKVPYDDEIYHDNDKHNSGRDYIDDFGGRDEEDSDGEVNENTVIECKQFGFNAERAIQSKFNGVQTFDQLIERELEKETEHAALDASTPVKPKRHTFLKRGEGLKRFQRGTMQQQKQRAENIRKRKGKFNNRVGVPLRLDSKKDENKPTLSNVNIKNDIKSDTRKYEKTTKRKTNNSKETKLPPQHLKITQAKDESDKDQKNMKSSRSNAVPDEKELISTSELEMSFSKMLNAYKEREELEHKELDAFEALEEAAENVSLSSNSSLVMKFLGKKKADNKKVAEKGLPSQVKETHKVPLAQVKSSDQEEPIDFHKQDSFEFDDACSWSDDSHISLNDTTLVNHTSPETSIIISSDEEERPTIQPVKRVISKKKLKLCDELESSIGNVSNENATEQKLPDKPSNDAQVISSILSSTDVSDIVKKKLIELEKEIAKFRLENQTLSQLRVEREKDLKTLRKEIDAFQKEKNEELNRINEYREEEMKKIKTERKVFDKYQKVARTIPNKKERDEIKNLKEECEQVKADLKIRETRWNSASHRFRSRINELEEENRELKEEIRVLEQERLGRWKYSEYNNADAKKSRNHSSLRKSLESNYSTEYEAPARQQPQAVLKNMKPIQLPLEVTTGSKVVSPEANILTPSIIQEKSLKNLPNAPTILGSQRDQDVRHDDGKVEVLLPNQSKQITFPNGTKKTISKDEKEISIAFFNGDIKKILRDKRIIYFYAESQTTHTTFPDGMEMLEFQNKQIEKRYPDGSSEIQFPDQTLKNILPDGSEKTTFADGTIQKVDCNGVRVIIFPNGQKETHTRQFKRREYPNGTVKTVYNDGRQETQYSSGRLRVKDKDGNLLIDSFLAKSSS